MSSIIKKRKSKKKSKKDKTSIWYNGIKGVKKSNVNINLSDEQIKEIKKCMQDPFYFIEKYVKLRTLDNGISNIKLRKYQKDMIGKMFNNRFLIAMMARQMGKTSTVSIFFLWHLLFHDNFSILVLANVQKKAKEIIDEIKNMYKKLPIWLQEGVEEWNKLSITLESGSKISAEATKDDSGRGSTHNIVYIDEMAFIHDSIISEMMKATFPIITSGKKTKLIITSTPRGRNYFWKMYTDAKRGKSVFKHVFYHWKEHPDRDEKFKENIINTFGERYWSREFECSFDGTSETFLEPHILECLTFKNPLKELIIQKEKYKLKQYELPMIEHNYILTLDPSEGIGQDYTGIHVWDITEKNKRKQVATLYDNKLSIMEAPHIIAEIARLYNDALIIAENNKCEGIIDNIMEKCDYDNIFFNYDDNRWGIRMSEGKKRRALKQMEIEFEAGRVEVNDYDYIHELSVFIKKGKSYEADDGEHDDLVMSSALLFWMMSYDNLYKEFIEDKINYMKDVHGIDYEESDGPMVFFENGIEMYNLGNK